jgi:hypothetical protein
MDVLRHNDIPENIELVTMACLFERRRESSACGWSAEVGFATITTEGEEVKIACVLITTEAPRHGWIVGRMGGKLKMTLVGDGGGKEDPSVG